MKYKTIRYIFIVFTTFLFASPTIITDHEASAQQPVQAGKVPHRSQAFALLPTTPIQRIDTSNSAWDPSSPDPVGVAFWSVRESLLIADSEVDEISSYFTGDNVFESSINGSLLATCSTTDINRRGWSREPTGVAINPNNNHIFFSDDSRGGYIHEVKLGADGIYCTSDDTVTTVPAPGSGDAEGIAYGENKIFIAGGVDKEIYIIDLGSNRVLGGGDDGEVTSIDTGLLGFHDLEGVEYNPDAGTLFIVSTAREDHYIGEVSLTGELIHLYDLEYLGEIARSGLAYGPSSWNPDTKSIYLACPGVDNHRDPDENDGDIWEIHLGEVPTHEKAPSVIAITKGDPDPASLKPVRFTVVFSKPVVGVTKEDFALNTSDGIESASILSVSGSDATYTVTVNPGTGEGKLQLVLVDRDRIVDNDGKPLGGPGNENGNFETGETYTVEKGLILIEPEALDFGDTALHAWSSTKTVTISNDGANPVQLGILDIQDDSAAGQCMFLHFNNCNNVILDPGQLCTFGVAFKPARPGAVDGKVAVWSDIEDLPFEIELTGNGISWINFLSDFFEEFFEKFSTVH